MTRPQALQKCPPPTLRVPHWEQNLPELVTGTILTGIGRVSAAQAQMNATIQPTTVHPSSRFTAKIKPASFLSRPIIVGSKYRKPRNRRKNMGCLFPLSTKQAELRCFLKKYTPGRGGLFPTVGVRQLLLDCGRHASRRKALHLPGARVEKTRQFPCRGIQRFQSWQ